VTVKTKIVEYRKRFGVKNPECFAGWSADTTRTTGRTAQPV